MPHKIALKLYRYIGLTHKLFLQGYARHLRSHWKHLCLQCKDVKCKIFTSIFDRFFVTDL